MLKDELNSEYFEWMCQLVYDNRRLRNLSYQSLFEHLHNIDFNYILSMDSNRAEDGISLRYRFGYENSYEYSEIGSNLDIYPCSILEMMVALAIRCEEDIMGDPEIGNRIPYWFWSMIDNLGLGNSDDSNYDVDYVDGVISKFLERRYSKDGKGSLFWIKNPKRDLRHVEIWYQMCWYLDEMGETDGT